MAELDDILETLILEHQQAVEATGMVQKTINDVVGQERIEETRRHFVPGRFVNQLKMLGKVEELFGLLDKGLRSHFLREERALKKILPEISGGVTEKEFKAIFKEHKMLLKRLAETNESLSELVSGDLSRALWQSQVWDMRAYMAKTAKLLKEHVEKETVLFQRIGNEVKGVTKTGF